jgi:hypothetical protein
MPNLTEGAVSNLTPGIPIAFRSLTHLSLSGTISSRAAVSMSPAAPIPHSKYKVFILFIFLITHYNFPFVDIQAAEIENDGRILILHD